jgi:hypothetical protein
MKLKDLEWSSDDDDGGDSAFSLSSSQGSENAVDDVKVKPKKPVRNASSSLLTTRKSLRISIRNKKKIIFSIGSCRSNRSSSSDDNDDEKASLIASDPDPSLSGHNKSRKREAAPVKLDEDSYEYKRVKRENVDDHNERDDAEVDSVPKKVLEGRGDSNHSKRPVTTHKIIGVVVAVLEGLEGLPQREKPQWEKPDREKGSNKYAIGTRVRKVRSRSVLWFLLLMLDLLTTFHSFYNQLSLSLRFATRSNTSSFMAMGGLWAE